MGDLRRRVDDDPAAPPWAAVLSRVRSLARDVVAAAAARCPGFRTAGDGPRRVACYGLDVLFDRDWVPVLLEVQFDPVPKPGFEFADLEDALLGRDPGRYADRCL